MASALQREANRRNGRLGGPKTESGKQRSRHNSTRHGLTAATLVVLPEEDRHEYENVLRDFRHTLQPCGAVEDVLVSRLAQTHWRSLRSRSVETGMLDIVAASQRGLARQHAENCPEHLHPHKAIGVGFMLTPPEQWHTWLRYDTTIAREFFRTLDTLTRMQRARQTKHQQPLSAAAAAVDTGAELSDSGIRFVSQNGLS